MLKFPIYLDYSATTPVDPRVAEKMIPYLTELFGNPASRSHPFGWTAEKAVEEAREEVAALVGADSKEIIWTSGATESNNLAIKGAAHFYSGKGKHIITLKTEHKAVLDTMRELERQGFDVTYLDVQEDGLVNMDALKAAIRPDTILISILFVNNEIGVIQDIPAIGALCRLRELGRSVPDDVAVVGYDDIDICPFQAVPLATVRQPFGDVGSAVVDLLFQVMGGGPAASLTLPSEFVWRESAGRDLSTM